MSHVELLAQEPVLADGRYLEKQLTRLAVEYQVRIYFRPSDVREATSVPLPLSNTKDVRAALALITTGSTLQVKAVGKRGTEFVVFPDSKTFKGYGEEVLSLGRSAAKTAQVREKAKADAVAARESSQPPTYLLVDEPLYRAFDRIGKRYGVDIFYHPDDVPSFRATVQQPPSLLEAFSEATVGTNLLLVKYDQSTYVVAPANRQEKAYAQNIVEGWRSGRYRSPDEVVLQTLSYTVGEGVSGNTEAVVSGLLRDAETNEALIGAVVFHAATSGGTATDVDGTFSLTLPLGEQRVELRMVGYEVQPVLLDIRGGGSIGTVDLTPQVAGLQEVVVTARDDARSLRESSTALRRIGVRELELLPATLGELDVLQVLTRTAGVASTSEGSSAISVRGGSLDANLVRQGGMPVLYPAHALGFFPLFHPDLVGAVDLYRGFVPASIGGRAASVVDVEWRTGDMERAHLSGSIGSLSSRLAVDGPLIKNRVSIIAGGRLSHLNYLLRSIRDGNVRRTEVDFNDLSIGLTGRWKGGRVDVRGARTFDFFNYAQRFGFEYTNTSYRVAVRQRLTNRLYLRAEVVRASFDSEQFDLRSFPGQFTYQSGLQHDESKASIRYTATDKLDIEAGLQLGIYRTPARQQATQGESTARDFRFEDPNLESRVVFGQLNYRPSAPWEIKLGVRALQAITVTPPGTRRAYIGLPALGIVEQQTDSEGATTYEHPIAVQPRVSLSFAPSGKTYSLGVSYSRLAQAVHQLSPTITPTPADIYFTSSRYLPLAIADIISASYAKQFGTERKRLNLELGVYHRATDQLTLARDGQFLRSTDAPERGFYTAPARAYGVELSIEKRWLRQRVGLAYTYGRSYIETDRRYPETASQPLSRFSAPTDLPHQWNINYAYEPSGRFTIGLAWTYTSGRPYTAVQTLVPQAGALVPTFGTINGSRLPPTHRLDFNVSLDNSETRQRGLRMGWGISLYNVYQRENPFSIFYEAPEQGRLRGYRFALIGDILPAFNLTFKLD